MFEGGVTGVWLMMVKQQKECISEWQAVENEEWHSTTSSSQLSDGKLPLSQLGWSWLKLRLWLPWLSLARIAASSSSQL